MPVQSKLAAAGLPRLPDRQQLRSALAELVRLYLANRSRISRAVWAIFLFAAAHRVRNAVAEQKAASARRAAAAAAAAAGDPTALGAEADRKKERRRRVELDREFFRALLRLLRVVVPGWRSKETRLLASYSFFLVLRTLISVKVAAMDGAIVKSLVKGNGREFMTRIVWWMLIALPATFTNSMVSPSPSRASAGRALLTADPRS